MLQACDVGHRVVVRRRLPGWPRFTDLLGVLVSLDHEHLVIRTENGTEQAVPLADVEAAKPVPPRPARYSEIAALELIADRAWPAATQERLGGWRLRAAQGWTNRANSALPLGEAGLSLADTVAACVAFYRSRGLPPKITVPLPLRRDVATHLAGAGWVAQPTVLVQTAPIAALGTTTAAVDLLARPSEDFLAAIAARKASLPESALHVLLDVPAVRFAEVRDPDGTLLAITRGAALDKWLHIGLVEVIPAARRRGLAQVAAAALADWAAGLGATRAVLQVEADNHPAVALYARQGFTTHHTYITYRLDR